MGLFRDKKPKISFGRFKEDYFHSNINRFLWKDENLLSSGFFTNVQDDSDRAMIAGLGGNEYTYLALTEWRLIESFLANGDFVTVTYEKSKLKPGKSGGKYFLSYISPINEIATYEINLDLYSCLEDIYFNKIPKILEQTTFNFKDEQFPPMFFCNVCDAKNLTNGIEDKPVNCRSCFRVNSYS
jgi:hypothetical protein